MIFIDSYKFTPRLWRPDQLGSTLALWLDAEDTASITLNGSNVSQWSDKSGRNTHAVQAAASSQPSYSASSFFGKPGLTFDGTDDTLIITTSLMQNNTTHGVYWVMERVGAGTGDSYRPDIGVLHGTNLDRGALHYIKTFNVGASFPFYSGSSETTFYDNHNQGGEYDTGVGYIKAFQSNVTGWGVWRNGTLEGTTSGLGIPDNTNIGYSLARQFHQNRASNIRMSEVIAVSSTTTADRQKIEGYLAWKWGLVANLPVDHPFKSTPPTF
jgi:hypothetical protein